MLVTVLPAGTVSLQITSDPGRAYLIRDNWNDWYTFVTQFYLVVFDAEGNRHGVGQVKIGEYGMTRATPSPSIPDGFDALEDRFFSLGQDENYYETLYQLGELGRSILASLRDVAADLSIFARAREELIMTESLMRYVSDARVRGRFSRLARGDAALTEFAFTYEFPAEESAASPPISISFEVKPESLPPTNIHVLIGRNGVGKTRCLTTMARAIAQADANVAEVGAFKGEGSELGEGLFANLVSVTFSAFDLFGPLAGTNGIRYSYIGLKRSGDPKLSPKTPEELAEEFVASVGRCRTGARVSRWRKALETLEADPLFEAEDMASLSRDDSDRLDVESWESRARHLYTQLSSGHKIVLLTITRLVETVDERTLVLLDEPEAHLHPPLLAAFVRALSDLLIQRNGVAIIATHSPVVLQEAPRKCVWILRRSGTIVDASRPSIETFGENVGILTREVFGLEVTQAGFHKLLELAVAKGATDYEAVLHSFEDHLGAEARVIVRGLLASRDIGQPTDT